MEILCQLGSTASKLVIGNWKTISLAKMIIKKYCLQLDYILFDTYVSNAINISQLKALRCVTSMFMKFMIYN